MKMLGVWRYIKRNIFQFRKTVALYSSSRKGQKFTMGIFSQAATHIFASICAPFLLLLLALKKKYCYLMFEKYSKLLKY